MKNNMKEEVKNFVDAYNRHVEWNREILKGGVNLDDFKGETRDIIRHYLDTNIITEEEYELDRAKIYYYTDKHPIKSELQVFNLKSACTYYFWCVEDMTEEEYKEERYHMVTEELDKHKKELQNTIKSAKAELKDISKLYNLLNDK